MSEELRITILAGILAAPFAVYMAYKLQNSYTRRQENHKLILPLIDSLRATLPDLQKGIEDAYVYPTDVTKYRQILQKAETTSRYSLLPEKTKKLLEETTSSLDRFIVVFRDLRIALYRFYESMRNPSGGSNLPEILATSLILTKRESLQRETVLVNFPRESKGNVRSVLCKPDEVGELWVLAQDINKKTKFLQARTVASDYIARLIRELEKLQKI